MGAGRQRRILDRNHADADEAFWMRRAKFRDRAIDMRGQCVGVIGGKPMRQQLRHRGNNLDVDIIRLHVPQAARGIPAPGVDDAKYLSAHNDRGGITFSEFDGRPERITSRRRRHGFRHKMSMDVDCLRQPLSPRRCTANYRVDQLYYFTSRLDCF